MIDVSKWNGTIDWSKVKAEGYHVIMRCGYGAPSFGGAEDPMFKRNASECERLGIPYGVYLYSYANSVAQAKQEAQFALSLVKGQKLSYPIYYDLEEQSYWSIAADVANAFGDIIEKAGYWCGVYANENWWRNSPLSGVSRFTRWVAKWSANKPSVQCDIWQYTSDGAVNGVNGRVDMDWCYYDFPSVIGGAKPPSVEPEGDLDNIVADVFLGYYGDGQNRRDTLGSKYDEVQARVNYVDDMANQVMHGRHGNGEARVKALGDDYGIIQFRVNQLLVGDDYAVKQYDQWKGSR